VPRAGTPTGAVERLIADLGDAGSTTREAAVARLRVIGARAFPHLSSLIASSAPAPARAAALTAIEGVHDPRSMALALAALQDVDTDVVVAAVGVLRGWLTQEAGTQVLEAITALALDKRRDAAVRLAALDALSELPSQLVAPIRERAPVATGERPELSDPAALRAWLSEHEATAPLSALHDAVTGARDREGTGSAATAAGEWTRVRGAAHVALANRGSRVAMYDLREAFDLASGPLPTDFLAAVARVGDDSCLEPLARAWAGAKGEPWWRSRLMEAAKDIVARLRLSGRHATLKRVRTKWPGFL
jgi:hypothetical protein